MIADLLVEGKTGAELESALKNWENGGRGVDAGKGVLNDGEDNPEGGDNGRWGGVMAAGDRAQMESVQRPEDLYHSSHGTQVNIDGYDESQPRYKTPPDDRFKVPLTAMFKRSLSTPAMHFTSPADASDHENNSVTGNFSDVISDNVSSPGLCSPSAIPSEQHEDHSIAAYNDLLGHLSPLVLPSGLGDGSPAHWNDVSSVNLTFHDLY